MYMSNIRGLGQTYSKPMTLQKAVTSILTTTAGVEAFPGQIVVIDAARFDLIAQQITGKANEVNWEIPIKLSEAQQALQYRGYRRDVATIAPVVFRQDEAAMTPVVFTPSRVLSRTTSPSPLAVSRQNGPGGVQLPVIIPISPTFPFLPDPQPPTAGGTNKTFLWIAGLLALYFLTTAGKNPHRSARRKRKASDSGDLSGLEGATANCVIWQEVEGKKGGLIWRCLGYGSVCDGKSCQKPTFKFQTRTCIKTKKVATKSPRFKLKTVDRCEKYKRVCSDGSCVPESLPKPDPSPGHGTNVKRMVSDLSKQLADDRNVDEETAGKAFGREIMDRGGIRPYRGRSRSGKRVMGGEEFAAVPIFMRRKEGLPLDEMAAEMKFEDDTALLEAIKAEYPKVKGEKKRVWTAADFVAEAESQVWSAIDAGMVSGLGQDLFPKLKRELVLTTADTAMSDDPLEIFLQRKGWDVERVRELQDSIAEKAVPDMFTKEVTPLTAGEVELQRDIDEFMKPVSTKAKKARKPKKDPFWLVDPVQQSLFGLGTMSTDRLAEGVREAISQDAGRMAHGDTSKRAFFLTPELDVIPWEGHRKKLKKWAGNASVHSHSAENWKYLHQLTGKKEATSRFSDTDVSIFSDNLFRGYVDTDVLIMADGSMIVVRCDKGEENLGRRSNVVSSLALKRGWREMAQYKGMSYPDAKRKRQKDFVERANCEWIETRWRPEDPQERMLFHTIPGEQQRRIDEYLKEPEKSREGQLSYRKKITRATPQDKDALTKAFWIDIDPALYPVEPVQAELFTTPQRTKRSSRGEKRITMGPSLPPAQMRLLGR